MKHKKKKTKNMQVIQVSFPGCQPPKCNFPKRWYTRENSDQHRKDQNICILHPFVPISLLELLILSSSMYLFFNYFHVQNSHLTIFYSTQYCFENYVQSLADVQFSRKYFRLYLFLICTACFNSEQSHLKYSIATSGL